MSNFSVDENKKNKILIFEKKSIVEELTKEFKLF